MRFIFLAGIVAAALSACASTSGYGPQQGSSGFGYSEQRIEAERYRVTYRARDASTAENGALRRAAELTRISGFDYFTVVSRDLERVRGSGPRSSVGIGGSTGSRSSGIGIGISVPITGSDRGDATARLEILMGRGDAPSAPQTYDAEDLLRNLGGPA